jgi:hypothetical protein
MLIDNRLFPVYWDGEGQEIWGSPRVLMIEEFFSISIIKRVRIAVWVEYVVF